MWVRSDPERSGWSRPVCVSDRRKAVEPRAGLLELTRESEQDVFPGESGDEVNAHR